MSGAPVNVRSLFAAARADAPDDEARAEMWDRVAMATGIAATTAAAASASASAAPTAASGVATGVAVASSASKLLAIGALIGVLSAVAGVLVAVHVMQPSAGAAAPGAIAPARPVHAPASGARLAEPASRPIDPAFVGRPPAEQPATTVRRGDPDSDLAEEARLVTDARAALVAGDPARALALIRGVRRLATRALEPEELGLEARALRALGRADEAAAAELRLKNRFPDHALAR